MSGLNPQNDLKATIEKLQRMSSNKKAPSADKVKMKYFKAKPGKNNLVVLPTPFSGDPFSEWGVHKNLLDENWKEIACLKHNKGEECLICQVVDDLKRDNFKGNMDIWKPLEMKVTYFSPVIDLDNIEEGVQWWKYGKSVLSQFETWLLNLEGEEAPFYSVDSPEKVIVSYNKDAAPTDMYKLDKKVLKPFPASKIEEWQSVMKPLTEMITFQHPQQEVLRLLDDYMSRVKTSVEATDTQEDIGESKTSTKKK